MPAKEHLIRAAVALRGEAPHAWAPFLVALRGYSNEMLAEVLRCDPDKLPRWQGMALAINEVVATLEDAPSLHQKSMDAAVRKFQHAR